MRRALLPVACVVALVLSCGDNGELPTGANAAPISAGNAGTEFRPAMYPALAAVGSRVFVWGGSPSPATDGAPLNDGAVFDPEAETFEAIESSPFTDPLRSPSAVAVGKRVFVIGVACTADPVSTGAAEDGPALVCEPGTLVAAVYDVAAAEWSAVDLPAELAVLGPIDPAALLYPRAVAVGAVDSRVVLDAGPGFGDYWTFDIDTGEWTRLREPAVQIDEDAHARGQSTGGFDACVAGSILLVAESANPVSLDFARPSPDGVKVHALDLSQPESQWGTTESLTYEQVKVPEMSCSPQGALIYSSLPGGGSRWLDAPDLAWRAPGPQPEVAPNELVVTGMTWTGETFVGGLSRGGEAWSFDSSTLQWRTVPPLPAQPQVPLAVGVNGVLVFIADGPYLSADGAAPQGDIPPGAVVAYPSQP